MNSIRQILTVSIITIALIGCIQPEFSNSEIDKEILMNTLEAHGNTWGDITHQYSDSRDCNNNSNWDIKVKPIINMNPEDSLAKFRIAVTTDPTTIGLEGFYRFNLTIDEGYNFNERAFEIRRELDEEELAMDTLPSTIVFPNDSGWSYVDHIMGQPFTDSLTYHSKEFTFAFVDGKPLGNDLVSLFVTVQESGLSNFFCNNLGGKPYETGIIRFYNARTNYRIAVNDLYIMNDEEINLTLARSTDLPVSTIDSLLLEVVCISWLSDGIPKHLPCPKNYISIGDHTLENMSQKFYKKDIWVALPEEEPDFDGNFQRGFNAKIPISGWVDLLEETENFVNYMIRIKNFKVKDPEMQDRVVINNADDWVHLKLSSF